MYTHILRVCSSTYSICTIYMIAETLHFVLHLIYTGEENPVILFHLYYYR